MVMPRPWLPLYGLSTTGPPSLRAALQRVGLAGDQSCRGTGKPSAAEDLVGLLLVAGEFDRDVRRACR